MQRNKVQFVVSIPRMGDVDLIKTCNVITTLLEKEHTELEKRFEGPGSYGYLRTLSSTQNSRQRILDKYLSWVESELGYMTMEEESGELYSFIVNKIHVLLRALEVTIRAINVALDGTDPSYILRDIKPTLVVPV